MTFAYYVIGFLVIGCLILGIIRICCKISEFKKQQRRDREFIELRRAQRNFELSSYHETYLPTYAEVINEQTMNQLPTYDEAQSGSSSQAQGIPKDLSDSPPPPYTRYPQLYTIKEENEEEENEENEKKEENSEIQEKSSKF